MFGTKFHINTLLCEKYTVEIYFMLQIHKQRTLLQLAAY